MDDSEWFKAFLSVSSRIDYIYHFRYRLLLVRFQICMMYVLSWSTTSELEPVNRLETIWGVCTPHAFAVEFPVLQRVLDNVFAYRCDIVTFSRIPPIFPALFPAFLVIFFYSSNYHLNSKADKRLSLFRSEYSAILSEMLSLTQSPTFSVTASRNQPGIYVNAEKRASTQKSY